MASRTPFASTVGDEFGEGLAIEQREDVRQRVIAEENAVGFDPGSPVPSGAWERKLKDGTLWHAGQALISWCVGPRRSSPQSQPSPGVLCCKRRCLLLAETRWFALLAPLESAICLAQIEAINEAHFFALTQLAKIMLAQCGAPVIRRA